MACRFTKEKAYIRLSNEKAHIRLSNEYAELKKDPIPGIVAKPLDESLLLWGYVIHGAKDTPFDGIPLFLSFTSSPLRLAHFCKIHC